MYSNFQPKKVAKVSSKVEREAPEVVNWVDRLTQTIDELSEGKSNNREESLETLVDILASHHASSQIEDRLEDVLGSLKRSLLKNSSAHEACLAAKGIALTFINMEDISESEGDDLYRRILPSLRNRIKDSEQVDIKISCLQTLALITYTAASDIDKQLVRDYLFDLIETDGADFNVENLSPNELDNLFSEALQAYGILFAASFTTGVVDFDVLWEELENPDKDIRISAGENVGLMFETANIFLKSDSDEEGDGEEETVKPEYDNMDGLLYTLKELSIDSSRRRAKSDRTEQKSVFRDVVRSVEENVRPSEELKIGGKVLTFRGWAKILPLNAFRHVLGQGFQHHLKTNDMMKGIFRYSIGRQQEDADDSGDDDAFDKSTLSNVDRKFINDENKKSRTKQLRNARLGKEGSGY
ncbi:interferon-related developmental regulator 2 isoformX2 [Mucor ambiguus]|uniref:Interferon-related developmental regulator 2 isoformX2 n=1 Tax=Mucor ambiguus TaxID=91626 RepID=A0A0C9MMH1_9FUNG|nr:interferon-related developmental regulator 2 isoformX2 [Mucor ambiguus]